MTREEAINYLEMSMAIGEDDDSRYHNEVLEFIIKSLEQQPCEDCVNRQAVIDIVTAECVDLQDGSELWRSCVNDTVESIYLKVEDLPPVTPQPQPNIKALGEDMRICQKSITDERC